MGLTKSTAPIDGWGQVAVGAIRKGNEHDVSGYYGAVLNVIIAHDSTNAHANGALVTIETRAGDEDEDWRELVTFRSAGGTAAQVNVDEECPAGSTQLKVNSTAQFETKNDQYFVKNASLGNSEIVRNNGFAGDDYIELLDGLTNTQEITSVVFDKVEQFAMAIPFEASRVRVLVWNDDADCTICTKTDIEKVIAV